MGFRSSFAAPKPYDIAYVLVQEALENRSGGVGGFMFGAPGAGKYVLHCVFIRPGD